MNLLSSDMSIQQVYQWGSSRSGTHGSIVAQAEDVVMALAAMAAICTICVYILFIYYTKPSQAAPLSYNCKELVGGGRL